MAPPFGVHKTTFYRHKLKKKPRDVITYNYIKLHQNYICP